MTERQTTHIGDGGLSRGLWRLDPATSVVEFSVRHIYGLVTIRGRFTSYEGTLNLTDNPAVQLTIDADSIDTKIKLRDRHLRSAHYFDTKTHPTIRYQAQAEMLDGDQLKLSGQLDAAGGHVPVSVIVTCTPLGDTFAVEGHAVVDQRKLGMTHNPLGLTRTPSRLTVRGRLVRLD